MRFKIFLLVGLFAGTFVHAQTVSANRDNDTRLENLHPLVMPKSAGPTLRKGDRLAICGDSITEQKMYSRIMEDYLTMCVPELGVTVRQYGWSGERASGFLARMTNDCLRFKPTIATTCYGMNDHEYRAYEDQIGQTYRAKSLAIVEAFKANRVRVIQGSPGCVGKMPGWVKTASGTVRDLNLNLCTLRGIGFQLAEKEKVGFADVFAPMYNAGVKAQSEYSPSYAIAGGDGVHPGWAGHTVMAYAFLKALGLDGDLGTLTVNLRKHNMTGSKGHDVFSLTEGEYQITSSRYPFCSCAPASETKPPYPVCDTDNPQNDNSIRSAMTLIPFNQELNRFTLIGRNGKAKAYKVTWGGETKRFTAGNLARGVNLAEEFPSNPFGAAFARVDAAIAAKQAFETRQIKSAFRSQEAKEDMGSVAAQTEKEREPLEAAIKAAFGPVAHTIRISAE
jgi:lysophospholipase L1-like esterase